VSTEVWLASPNLRAKVQQSRGRTCGISSYPGIGLALFTGLLFGLYPALRLSRPNPSQVIQSISRTVGVNTSRRKLNILIGGQITITFVLLGAAGARSQASLRLHPPTTSKGQGGRIASHGCGEEINLGKEAKAATGTLYQAGGQGRRSDPFLRDKLLKTKKMNDVCTL
jgi:hypothetical protein